MSTYINPSVIELISPGIIQKNTSIAESLLSQGLDPELMAIIARGLNSVLEPGFCFYEKLVYMVELQSALLSICGTAKLKNVNDEVRKILFLANYNAPEFVAYYQTSICNQLASMADVSLQLEQLYFYQKEFSNFPQRRSAACFEPCYKRINDLMLDFVNAELEYLNQKYDRKGLVQQMDEYKIKVSFSVDALAYFIKLLIQAKVIDQGVRSELLAFIARRFQTPGISSKGMSVVSLGVKYKQVVYTTAMQVRAVLVSMIKLIDNEF